MTASNTRFHMGSIPLPFGDIRRLDGLVDEVSIYNRVLSPAEIHSIYSAGSAGKCHTVMDVDVQGNLTMRDSTSPAVGNILKNGVPFIHNFGTFNTFIGSSAGNLTMTGFENTGSGYGALSTNTSGFNNTATGFGSLSGNATGSNNTAIGAGALLSNIDGLNNTATGFEALHDNISGANTATGYRTLGYNTSGAANTAIGAAALLGNRIGRENAAVGFQALIGNSSGSYNTAIGSNANVLHDGLTNATAIGAYAIVNDSNKIRLGNTDVTVVEGPPYSVVSDRNAKENFRPVEGEEVLTKIRRISLTSWNYIGHDPKQFRHYGPVAQDFFAAFGHDGIGTVGTRTTITSTDLDGILMIAAQALEKRTVKQGKEVNALRAENAKLRARLDALERKIAICSEADPKGNVR
jgi:hypothetical protein